MDGVAFGIVRRTRQNHKVQDGVVFSKERRQLRGHSGRADNFGGGSSITSFGDGCTVSLQAVSTVVDFGSSKFLPTASFAVILIALIELVAPVCKTTAIANITMAR